MHARFLVVLSAIHFPSATGDNASVPFPEDPNACIWSDPPTTINVKMQNTKSTRTCWEASGQWNQDIMVYYQAKVDIHHGWNMDRCCMKAAPEWGSKPGGPPNIHQFKVKAYTPFGWCECKKWAPDRPDAACGAGSGVGRPDITCPVLGDSDQRMCSDGSLGGAPAKCSPMTTTTTTAAAEAPSSRRRSTRRRRRSTRRRSSRRRRRSPSRRRSARRRSTRRRTR